MSYKLINKIPQFNFQINRILTYGEKASDEKEVTVFSSELKNIEEWYTEWNNAGNKAEKNARYMHSAYYIRMAEFFLKHDDKRKKAVYEKCIHNFYLGFNQENIAFEKYAIPFENGCLNCIRLGRERSGHTILICGGYDSFIEEFVLQASEFAEKGYEVILFEGPGQGECLIQDMFFNYDFEKCTSCVIDYFKLRSCAMIGISWGGYFALRCAAFDKRITHAAAYDAMDNGYEVMTNIFPKPIRNLIRYLFKHSYRKSLNRLTDILKRKNILADWALSQGTYITGTKTAYDFYLSISEHCLKKIYGRITQNVLLLAGEKDHYIPICQFERLKVNLINCSSLRCRLFTQAEGGEQHCQTGNHLLAINEIANWLNEANFW